MDNKRLTILSFLLTVAMAAAGCSDDTGGGAKCGDGVIDTDLGEQCDSNSLGGRNCEDVAADSTGGTLRCHPPGTPEACTYDISQCDLPECGNGTLEAGEECDGYDHNGQTCVSLGHDAGQLGCYGPEAENPCTYDESECLDSPYCGDGHVDAGEECDGSAMNAETCVTLGYLGGDLDCGLDCSFDTSGCLLPECGNDTQEATELCDGADLAGEDCISRGYLEGTLACDSDCMGFDESGCSGQPVCDDGVIEGWEVCDSTDLAGQTCISRGYLEGDLACGADCLSFDESGCSGTTNCVADHDLGTLTANSTEQVTGDFANLTDDAELTCSGAMMANDVVVFVTIPAAGSIEVEYDLGMAMSGGVALYAPSVECGDTELECVQGEMGGMGTMAGTATFSNLSPGMYYVIAESMSLMGGAYTLGITYVP